MKLHSSHLEAPGRIHVTGGASANDLLMGFQADLLDVPLVRPEVVETTALGAAFAAGLAVAYWSSMDDLRKYWSVDKTWESTMDADQRQRLISGWKKAVTRTFDWVD